MEQSKIEKLKMYCNQFYLNIGTETGTIDDKEFDALAKEYSDEFGYRSWMKLVDFPSELVKEDNLPEAPLEKTPCDGDFDQYIDAYKKDLGIDDTCYLNYKYDGCAIKAIYENGRLKTIKSTPDESIGIVRTKAFYSLFPNELEDKSIIALRGEVLVDAAVYGELARNKANGLTNSIYMDEDVKTEAFVRIYKVQYSDGDNNFKRQLDTLLSLHPINVTRTRPVYDEVTLKVINKQITDTVFCIAERVFDLPKNTIIQELVTESKPKFQIDGVVLYSEFGTHAFKFYYTDYAIVTINKINWNYKWQNGSYAPVAEFDTVYINGKAVSKCSLNGCNTLFDNKVGRGAKVKIILANLTIPYIIEVLETSEDYMFPVCDCGYQLSAMDQFSNSLKCQNDPCSRRVADTLWQLEEWITYIEVDNGDGTITRIFNKSYDYIMHEPHYAMYLFGIDRFNPANKFIGGTGEEVTANMNIFTILENSDNKEDIEYIIAKWYKLSDLQWSLLHRNIYTVKEVLNKFKEYNGSKTYNKE